MERKIVKQYKNRIQKEQILASLAEANMKTSPRRKRKPSLRSRITNSEHFPKTTDPYDLAIDYATKNKTERGKTKHKTEMNENQILEEARRQIKNFLMTPKRSLVKIGNSFAIQHCITPRSMHLIQIFRRLQCNVTVKLQLPFHQNV